MIPIAGLLALGLAGAFGIAGAEEAKTETRLQAVLKIRGTILPDGGYRVTEVNPDGPAANLDLPDAVRPTRGILEKGDVIVAVAGKSFADHRQFLDLMNQATRKGGKVRLTVKDVNTGRTAVWIATPVYVWRTIPPSSPEVASRRRPNSARVVRKVPKLRELPKLPESYFGPVDP
jgi:hypothetical protein